MIRNALDDGFRLLFLGAAATASLQVVLWAGFLFWGLELPGGVSPVVWHGRELLFGFAAALVAGFLLTAVGNWTARRVAGPAALAALFGVWLLARIAAWLPLPTVVAGWLTVAFLLLLVSVVAVPIVRSRNARNFPIVIIVTAFAGAGAALAVTPSPVPLRFAVDVLLVLMAVVGARIVPFFTGRRFPELGVTAGGRSVPVMLAALLAALAAQWLAPDASWTSPLQAIAGIAVLVCLVQWRPWRVLREPMLWILHLGYAWLGVSMLLRAFDAPGSVALHAATVGALGCLAIGMMVRVALGHTGRPLRADGWMVAAFVLVALAAIPRLAFPFLGFDLARFALGASALAWSGGFALYFVRFLPVMFSPRR